MELVLSAPESRLADEYTKTVLGVPEEELILRAGSAVAEIIRRRFCGGKTLVLVGKGNNGKDGRVIADKLNGYKGFQVSVYDFLCPDEELFSGDYEIIVDCIFGTGLKRNIEGEYAKVIDLINRKSAYKIACDIPSGLNSDNGNVMGTCFKADLTVTVQEYKAGLILNDGPDFAGETVKVDIGIKYVGEEAAYVMDDTDVLQFFPKRLSHSNKGSYGKCTLIGGSKNYVGSCLLSGGALAALKTGVGYANLAVPEELFAVYAGRNPEVTLSTLSGENGFLSFDKKGLEKLLKYGAIAFGMGAGVSEAVYESLKYIIENYNGKLLIDADGINSLAAFGVDILKNKSCEIILTPHVKEFSRLSGRSVEDITNDFIGSAKRFAIDNKVTVLLKSNASSITDGKRTCINTTGNSSLAKAGSGDVLSGMICGLMGRGLSPFDAGKVASYILGRAAEIASKAENEYSVTATDVIKRIGEAINSL